MLNAAREASCVQALGFILQASESRDIAETCRRNLEDAVALHVFGAPSYVVAGELFWGQDRLEQLDAMLSSRQTAFEPP